VYLPQLFVLIPQDGDKNAEDNVIGKMHEDALSAMTSGADAMPCSSSVQRFCKDHKFPLHCLAMKE
jgi:hypothetical protein